MAEQCFKKKDSNPPVCGAHNVPLVQHQSSDVLATSRLGEFTFLVCPVSGAVLDDEAKQPRG
jgi:hypothetical protein